MLKAKLSQEPYLVHLTERFIKGITPLWLQMYCFKNSALRFDFLCTNLKGFSEKISIGASDSEKSTNMEEFGFWVGGGGAGVASISLSSYQGFLKINIVANSERIREPGAICDYFVEELGKIVASVEIDNISAKKNQ
jgi:hypothetical protein